MTERDVLITIGPSRWRYRIADSLGPLVRAMRRLSGIFGLGLLLASALAAQEPELVTPPGPNDGPVTASIEAGGMVTLPIAEEGDAAVTPLAFVGVDGPLALGQRAPLRLYARLGIVTAPGETSDLLAVETYKAGDVELGAYRILGQHSYAEAGQDIRFALGCSWGFSSRWESVRDPPLERLARRYGCGPLFFERSTDAWLSVQYGRAEVAGVRGWGQWLVEGRLPLIGAEAPFALWGQAILSVGKAREGIDQRDVLMFGIAADLGNIAAAIGKR